jgi:hypothetical protein
VDAAVQERGAQPERRHVRSAFKRCEEIHRQNVARSIYTNAVSAENLTSVHGRLRELSRTRIVRSFSTEKIAQSSGERLFRDQTVRDDRTRSRGVSDPFVQGAGQASRRAGGVAHAPD